MGEMLSPLVPFPVEVDSLAAIATCLVSFHEHLLRGSLYASFKHANPGEATRLEVYWQNGTPYPAVATQSGQAFRAAYEASHLATGTGG